MPHGQSSHMTGDKQTLRNRTKTITHKVLLLSSGDTAGHRTLQFEQLNTKLMPFSIAK